MGLKFRVWGLAIWINGIKIKKTKQADLDGCLASSRDTKHCRQPVEATRSQVSGLVFGV